MDIRLKTTAARVLHSTGVLAAVRSLRTRAATTILMIHRVLPREELTRCYDARLAVSAESFASLLDLLTREYEVVPLATELGRRSSKLRAVITFDDGWEDNARVALPLLAQRGLPATLFLCPALTSAAEDGAMLPEERFVRIWNAAQGRVDQLLHVLASASVRVPPGSGRSTAGQAMKLVAIDARLQLLQELERTFEVPPVTHRSFVTWDEARQMLQQGVTIGSHTMRHATLTSESDATVVEELEQSRAAIREHLGHQTTLLAYPNGACNAGVAELAKRAGYSRAVTTRAGFATDNSAPLQLPRIAVEEAALVDAHGVFCEARARLLLAGLANS